MYMFIYHENSFYFSKNNWTCVYNFCFTLEILYMDLKEMWCSWTTWQAYSGSRQTIHFVCPYCQSLKSTNIVASLISMTLDECNIYDNSPSANLLCMMEGFLGGKDSGVGIASPIDSCNIIFSVGAKGVFGLFILALAIL